MQGCVFVESLQPVFVDNPKREAIHDAWFKFFRLITFWLQMGFKFVQVSLCKEPLLTVTVTVVIFMTILKKAKYFWSFERK